MNYEIIEIGENNFPMRFGFTALRKYSRKTGATLQDLNKLSTGEITLNDAFILIYCGIEDGHRAAKKEFRLSLDEVTDLFDGNMDCVQQAFEILGRSMSDDERGNGKAKKAKKSKKS
tara:strand:- start:643 stop:993 length:351 start_codon:yes stop_codon:yes gene_type:complete